jgi:segregation and condensation protein A
MGAAPEAGQAEAAVPARFTVRLTNFEGPFDLLLQLIGKHKLDVTEIALSKVTDEFIAHLRALGDQLDLDQASEFLVIASTLLDLKAARLLPAAEVDDEEDLELLEARDLLFARLLQYKAYKQAAAFLRSREAQAARRFPRDAALEPRFAEMVPEVLLGVTPRQFAALAAKALAPRAPQTVSVAHLHAPPVSVAEQLLAVRNQLMRSGTASFRALTADCGHTLEVVARFLALLELYRQQRVVFEQLTPLGDLTVRWTGGDTVDEATLADLGGTAADEEYA